MWIEVFDVAFEQGQEARYFETAEFGNHRMQGYRVADDGGDFRHETGYGRHHEAGGSLAVDHCLDLVAAGLFHDLLDSPRMIVEGGFVEGPGIGLKVDGCAPVFQPDVVPAIEKVLDDGALDGSTEQVCANAGTMNQQHRPFAGGSSTLDMDQVEGEAIAGFKGNDLFGLGYGQRFPRGTEMVEKCRAPKANKLQNLDGSFAPDFL